MKKPWIHEEGGRRLEAFLGSRGMRTSEIATTDELLQTAADVFEIPAEATCGEMADVIAALPKKQRQRLAKRNIQNPGESESARKPRARTAKTHSIKTLASELKVSPDELSASLKDLVQRRRTIADSQSKTLSQRAVEAERKWRSQRGSQS